MIKILSIDDQQDNQIAIKGALSSYFRDAQFGFALSGEAGINLAKEFHPDVVLLDIMMPGLDGFETCKLFKEDPQLRFIPVILLSAIGNKTENRIKGMQIGADAILSKPFDPGELAAQINVMLRIKAAEDQLRDENKKLDQLVNEKVAQIVYQASVLKNVSDAVISTDNEFIIKSWNEAAKKTYGWEELEAIGLNYNDLLTPDYQNVSLAQVMESVSHSGEFSGEAIHHDKKGNTVVVNSSFSSITDKLGKHVGYAVLNRNLAQEKADAKAIFDLTARLELAIKAVNLGIWEWDLITNQFDWNDEFAYIYGIEKDENKSAYHIFKKFLEFDQAKKVLSKLHALIETGEKVTIDHAVLNEKRGTRLVTSKAVKVSDVHGKTLKIIGVSYDITKRKETENQLSQSELRYRTMVETSNDMVWITDQVGNLTFYNQHLSEATGYELSMYIGRPMWFAFPLKTRKWVITKYSQALNGEKCHFETDMVFVDGENHRLWMSLAPVIYEGKVTGVTTFARDMSDYHMAMDELKRALSKARESDQLKSAFLATMSHELRTPLNAIIGFSSLLSPDMDKEEIGKYAEIVGDSGQHLLSIFEEIFDIVLIETGELKLQKTSFSIATFIEKVKNEAMISQKQLNKKEISFTMHVSPKVEQEVLFTDGLRLLQILKNLLKNAFKFTGEGSVTLGVEKRVGLKGDLLEFYVSDTGIGIPKNKQSIIFEPFRQIDDSHTRKYDGVGLGLSTVKRLVELLGGNITLTSHEGVGSTFLFTIPLVETEMRVNTAKTERKELILSNRKVLVVEDDADSYHFLELVLKKYGADTFLAHNGREALEYCKQNELPWVVLMDLNMPVMNGLEATRQLKALFPELPVIAQTAYAVPGDIEKARAFGCDDVIAKPVIISKLLLLLNKYL